MLTKQLLFCFVMGKFGADLFLRCKYMMGGSKEGRNSLLSPEAQRIARDNGLKVKYRKFYLNIRRICLMVKAVKHRTSCEVSILGDIQNSPGKGHEQPAVIDHTFNLRFFTILIHSVLLIFQTKIRLSLTSEDIFFLVDFFF